jgi:heme-degrading monooxygenase HmoA
MKPHAYHLIHANLAIARAPLDDPLMDGFISRVDEIDAAARRTPGFVAQPSPADEGQVYRGRALLNLSVWESLESLDGFTHSGEHAQALQRREEWFEQREGPNYVLFWAPAGEIPTELEIASRLDYLAEHGPTPYAFTFERPFTVAEALAYQPEEG